MGRPPGKICPSFFSPTQNVKWVADLPGPSAATPIIAGEDVFLSSVDGKEDALVALCFDRKTGKRKWRQTVGSGYRPAGEGSKTQLDDRSNYASPSPVTDGKRVIFFYGNGDLAAFDNAGSKLWQRNLQKEYGDFAFAWTFSSSPLLYDGKLYVQILQRNQPVGARGKPDAPSFLLALNPETGAELWRQERKTGAMMESREAFSSPIPYTHEGRRELLIAGGDVITGHDPATGKELWRWGTWNEGHREAYWRLVPSPVAGEGVVLICAPKRQPVYAAKLGGSGVLSEDSLVWKSAERSAVTSDVPTPVLMNGKFYIVSDVKKALSCVDAKTGKILWTTPTPGREKVWGSPAGADGKIYLINLDGVVSVADALTGKILSESKFDEPGAEIRGGVAIAHNNLFIRTSNKLYCIGN